MHRQFNIKTIITAAAGLDHLEIPSIVTHIVYPLKDAKSENIKSYFDESYATIDRSMNSHIVRIKLRRCLGSLRCWRIQGNFCRYIVRYHHYCLPDAQKLNFFQISHRHSSKQKKWSVPQLGI